MTAGFLSLIAVPQVRVSNLRVVNEAERSITIAWTPVGCLERNNLPVRVQVIIRELPLGQIIKIGNISDQGSYVSTGLHSETLYSFQVLATGLEESFRMNGLEVTGMTTAPSKNS